MFTVIQMRPEVSIAIETQEGEVIVEVGDNGRGFDLASVRVRTRGGAGIIGMRERAEVIGARLDVDSSSGSGCQVRLIVPIAMRASGDSASGMVDQRRSHYF